MGNNKTLEERLLEIENRNQRVERDKEWETSQSRKVMVAILTYVVMVVFMTSIGVDNPWLNAVVPTIGFILSTFSLTFIKNIWLKNNK